MDYGIISTASDLNLHVKHTAYKHPRSNMFWGLYKLLTQFDIQINIVGRGSGLRLYYDYIIIFSLKARCFAQAYINRPALSVCTKNGESVVVECRGALGLAYI